MKTGDTLGGGFLAPLDLQDLHLEDERVAPLDLRGAAAVPVAQLGRDVHLPLVPLHHQLHGLCPALDDLGAAEELLAPPRTKKVTGFFQQPSVIRHQDIIIPSSPP